MPNEFKKTMKTLEQNLPLLRKEFKVKRLGVFGSVARGAQHRGSDLDLLVEFSEPIGLFRFVALERHLSSIAGRKVDLVSKRALKPLLKKNILQSTYYVTDQR